MAQPGSAPALGAGGRRFKSCCPDQPPLFELRLGEPRLKQLWIGIGITMTARIYKPARTAMQSGQAKTREWVLDYEPEEPRVVGSLMGWTSSGDMKSQLRLRFASKEEAVAYCERHGIPYQIAETNKPTRRGMSY